MTKPRFSEIVANQHHKSASNDPADQLLKQAAVGAAEDMGYDFNPTVQKEDAADESNTGPFGIANDMQPMSGGVSTPESGEPGSPADSATGVKERMGKKYTGTTQHEGALG